jgi:hypothetical protein
MKNGYQDRVFYTSHDFCLTCRFANSLVYYGVSYGAVDLGGNKYLDFFLISIVEIPSGFAVMWSANR